MCMERVNSSAIVLNGRFYVAGGRDSNDRVTSAVESYNPESNSWTLLAPMNIPRAGFALIESNGFLYAFGRANDAEKYDPTTNCWTMVCEINIRT